jgi:hypothetical protein
MAADIFLNSDKAKNGCSSKLAFTPPLASPVCLESLTGGYIPFEPEAANQFFQLVSSGYECASLIATSIKPFGRWAEVFGVEAVAAAMIDQLVHHAEVA